MNMMCQRCGQPEPIYKHGMCQDCYGYKPPDRLEYARLLDVERNYKAGIAAAERYEVGEQVTVRDILAALKGVNQ